MSMSPEEENVYIYCHMDEKTNKGKVNKYEKLGSPLLQQCNEIGSFVVARELNYGSIRLRLFDAR
jgi:hypothetical protein